ncbi:MAG: hypothetical protein J5379_04935 [Clostridiales bacterium]|nr:hypothetical protein [Clostridiales bacterium]
MKIRKPLSFLLTLVMALNLLPKMAMANGDSSGYTLSMDSPTVVSVTDDGVSCYFTPPESGPYRFYSVGDYDPDATLLSGSGTIAEDNNDGNFSIASELTADTQYELQISDLEADEEPEEITVYVEVYCPNLAGYALSPTSYTLNGSGFTDITCSLTSLVLGDVNQSGKYVQVETITLYMNATGTMSDGNGHSIPFRATEKDHYIDDEDSDPIEFGQFWPGSADPFTLAVYIDPENYEAAEPGTYTGSLNYNSVWNDDDEPVAGESGTIALTLVVPRSSPVTWEDLQDQFSTDGEITLTQNITAPNGASALTVPKGKTVTLDLNGCTINRGLSSNSPAENGSVIIVNGTLIIVDSSAGQTGVITGGSTTGTGGGIWVRKNGSVTINGGTISGNYAQNIGGGVYISGSGSSFTLSSGTITGNTSRNGGGIGESSPGSITITGGSVTGNTATNNGGGVWYGGNYSSPFTMTGGSITNNTAAVKGGGVFVNSGTFTLNGGSITTNTAANGGGAYINGGSLDWTAGTISGNTATTDPEIGGVSGSVATYSVTISDGIGNGTVTADKTRAHYGETVTLTVTPDDGYVLRTLTVEDESGNPVTVTDNVFTMSRGNVTVTAEFRERDQYIVGIDNDHLDNKGRIELNNYVFFEGDTVTVTATPDSGRVTTSWVVMMHDEFGNGYNRVVPNVSHPDPNTITFPMPSADVKLYATFSDYGQWLVFTPTMTGGTVIADKTVLSYSDDPTVTLTIRPDNGYEYVPGTLRIVEIDEGMSEVYDLTPFINEVTENSQYSFRIGSNSVRVTASFTAAPEQTKYSVLVDDDTENGTLSADYILAEAGWTVKIKAEPESYHGYALESISVMDTSGNPVETTELTNDEYQYQFTMPAGDVFITGTFAIPVYEITVSNPDGAATGCEISADDECEAGFSVSVFVTVMPEKEMTSLTVAGDRTGTDYTDRLTLSHHNESSALYIYSFTMPDEPVTITGRFAVQTYTIATDENLQGTLVVKVNDVQQELPYTAAVSGDAISLVYTVPNFYTLNALKYRYTENGTEHTVNLRTTQQSDGTYTASFPMRSANVTILAALVQNGAIVYVDLNGVLQTATNVSPVTASTTSLSSGWYAVTESITNNNRINVSGNVNLILCNGATLTAPKGISVNEGNSLTIWGQTGGSGTLNAHNGSNVDSGLAGIGGNKDQNSGVITINGGTVKAKGGNNAAGIGGGFAEYGSGGLGTVVINSGTVIARGGSYAAGIGGGRSYSANGGSSSITINGGRVEATGIYGGAGIGGGRNSSATVIINGGNVSADFDTNGCGIGNGQKGSGATISLNWTNSGDSITSQSYSGTVTLTRDFTDGAKVYAAGAVADNTAINSKTLVPAVPYTITFSPGSGSGTMDSVTLVTGGVYTLPTCGFTAPEGNAFKEWSVVIGNAAAVTKAPGDKITATADTTVTAVWEYAAPTFIGYAMRLDGKITLQFFVGLPDDMTPDECYVTFEGKNVDGNKHYALSTEKCTKADGYVVELDISSIEMAELFTPTLHYTLAQGGNESTVTGNAYSAKEYIDHGMAHFSGNDLTIVKALADYGHYSQPYLSAQNNWRIGTDYAEMTTKWSNSFEHDVIKNATSSYVAVRTTSDDITAVTYKVRFGSEISIAVFLTPAEGVTIEKVTVDDKEITPTKSGNRYYVIISNISVTKLTESHMISYGTASIIVSPMSYVNGILSSGTTSDAAKNLVCALYNLAEACK